MTSLELSKAFEDSYKETFERQTELIKKAFEEKLDFIKDNIPSLLDLYDDDYSLFVGIVIPINCLDSVHKWAYEYFENMDNITVESILNGFSYSEHKKITLIELTIIL